MSVRMSYWAVDISRKQVILMEDVIHCVDIGAFDVLRAEKDRGPLIGPTLFFSQSRQFVPETLEE